MKAGVFARARVSDAATPRAHVDVVGVGLIEAHPFYRVVMGGPDWPDGTHHAGMPRGLGSHSWVLEREPRGWSAGRVSGEAVAQLLSPNALVHVSDYDLRLRPLDVPLAEPRLSLRGFDLVDVAWPLTLLAPRRLAAHDGRLVELIGEEPSDPPLGEAVTAFVLGGVRWSAVPARMSLPLRFLVDAGVAAPSPATPHTVDAYDVLLDGTLRVVPVPKRDFLRFRPNRQDITVGGALFPGVLEGLFPERVREWRELEEQVAMWPRVA